MGILDAGDHFNVTNIGPDYWKEMTRAYLACVSFVDAQAGKVLDALEASPYAENTIVVFWSDHGQHLGEKRHWRKQALWEESTRVPLSFYLPKRDAESGTCDRPVSLIDIYPTLLDLCSLPSVPRLEGTSLTPQLKDVNAPRTIPAVTTWYRNNHSVRGQRWRYIRYRDGTEEMYDHKNDPHEHVNLAGLPQHTNVKNRLKKFLPSVNVMPAKDDGLDAHEKMVNRLKKNGVPDWLGKVPSSDRDRP